MVCVMLLGTLGTGRSSSTTTAPRPIQGWCISCLQYRDRNGVLLPALEVTVTEDCCGFLSSKTWFLVFDSAAHPSSGFELFD
eukprot:2407634-Rhodomonas_salina.2